MSRLYRFFKSTILGGLVFLVPVVVIVAIVGMMIDTFKKTVMPIFDKLPDLSFGGVSLALVAAIVAIILVCFIAGLFAETAFLKKVRSRSEKLALYVPGYSLMKSVGANMVGVDQPNPTKVVMVDSGGSGQLGFLMSTLPDGKHVIFIPGVPGALVGSLHVVPADRVRLLAINVSDAFDILGKLGVGVGDEWTKSAEVTPSLTTIVE